MADIARLGFEVDSSGLKKGEAALEDMTGAAAKAEKATGGLTNAFARIEKLLESVERATRDVEKAIKLMGGASSNAGKQVEGLGASAQNAQRKVQTLVAANDNVAKSFGVAGAAASAAKAQILAWGAGLGAAALAAVSIGPLMKFEDAVAEVGTIVDRSTFDFDRMKKSALEMSRTFGGSAATQIQAFNDVLSAGTDDLGKAEEIVRVANQLAVGGATDVATATSGLTNIINAYGDKVGSVQEISDAMFIAMRDGKTTIAQLSSALGRVAPLAAQTGVSFDELTAAIAALTLGGVSTDESITGVRAILAAVAKPSSEAAKLAKALGLEFTAASLKAKGFQAFLSDLMKKTGGSTDALAVLMGGVEALAPVMALSGSAGKAFAATMDHMGQKAGATATAVQAIDEMSPGHQASRAMAAFQAEILGATDALNSGLVTALKGLADNMSNIVSVAKIAGAAMLVAFGPAILGAIATLTTTVGTGLAGAFATMWAAAGGPFTLIAAAIVALGVALWEFRDKIKAAFGIDLEAIATSALNGAINAYKFAAEAIPTIWKGIGPALKDVMVSAMNGVIGIIQKGLQNVIDIINNTFNSLNLKGLEFGVKLNLPTFGPVGEGWGLDNANAGASKSLGQNLSDMYQRQRAQNNFASKGRWRGSGGDTEAGSGSTPNAASAVAVPDLDALDKASKAAEQAAKKYSDLVRESNQFIAAQRLEQQTLGMSEQAAAAFRYEQEMLNKAANDNIALTSSQKTQIHGLATAMAAAEAATKAAKEAFDFAKDGLKGFLSDLRSGLKNGESFWTAFGNAASNVLDKIVSKIEDQLVNALMSAFSAGGGSGGLGSILGSLFGGGSGAGALAGGIGLYAQGGVVHAAGGGRITGPGTATSDSIPAMLSAGEFVVNAAAAKRFAPLLSAINDNSVMRFAAGGYVSAPSQGYSGRIPGGNTTTNNSSQAVTLTTSLNIDARGANMSEDQIRAAVAPMLAEHGKQLAKSVPGIVNAARARMNQSQKAKF